MFEQKRAYWRSLDNAAKLFSAASSPKDTRVFRFYCELKEEVEEKNIKNHAAVCMYGIKRRLYSK